MVWHLAGAGMSIEEIAEELARHPNGIGAKYAKRLLAEVTRCFNKWKTHRLTGVTGMAEEPRDLQLGPLGHGRHQRRDELAADQVIPSELPRIVNEAEDALILLGQEFYQRGGMLVRPVTGTIVNKDGKTQGWQLIPVARPYLVETLCCAADSCEWTDAAKPKVGSRSMRRTRWRVRCCPAAGSGSCRSLTALCRRRFYEPMVRCVKRRAMIR